MENNLNMDNLRLDVIELLEDIPTTGNGEGKFYIPVMQTESTTLSITTPNSNIQNKNSSSIRNSTLNVDDYVTLKIPYHCRLFFSNQKIIPSGTKFILGRVGASANVEDMKIIGLYDAEQVEKFRWDYYNLEKKVEHLIRAVSRLQARHYIDDDWSDD